MKRFIAAAAVLVLMGAGCGSEANVQTNANVTVPPATVPPSSDEGITIGGSGNVSVKIDAATVSFNGSAFSPSTVTISNGGTVTWRNDSSVGVQVASNPHPTHTDYPGFDSKAAINPGQVWSFTFTKPGTWGYHDHLNPSIGGTVIVK